MIKKVLVTGANGHVGSALIPLLIKEGWLVSGLVRKTSNIAAIKNYPIDLVYGDMADMVSVEKASRGCEIIFHLAAPTISYAAHEKGVALAGLKNVYESGIKNSVKRIVYISSTVTVGVVDLPNKKLDEQSFMHLTGTPYQDAKWELEQKALEYAHDKKLDLVIVNPSTIMGAGDLRPMPPNRLIIDFLNYAGNWQWLKDFQLRGAPVWFDTGFSVVDVHDVAQGIYLAGQKGKNGERYILSGDNITMRQLHQELSALTGLPTPFIYVPKKIMYAASFICTKLMTHPPISYDLAKTMVGRYAFFSCEKAQKFLGYTWTPHEKTLMKAIKWFLKTDFIRPDIKIKFKNVFP